MSGDVHVRFCESVGVKFPHATRLPLNRLENIFNRHGVKLGRSTMCGWMQNVAEISLPIYDIMIDDVLNSYSIHTDDTPIKLRDAHEKVKVEGRFWVYCGDDEHPYTVYDYTANRSHDGPEKFLGDYAGYMHADAYPGYDKIYDDNGATELACLAHARRKFFDSQDNDAARAHASLDYRTLTFFLLIIARPVTANVTMQAGSGIITASVAYVVIQSLYRLVRMKPPPEVPAVPYTPLLVHEYDKTPSTHIFPSISKYTPPPLSPCAEPPSYS